ncbi:MAG: glycosyltransferase [Verrucomicrobiaceae bacterium]|nr:glycosyltransferase [Verrucomicrobiaceae bacterium]
MGQTAVFACQAKVLVSAPMKILVSAFSCCPGLGSEPGVGWHTVEELAREHEVWVLVDRNWQPKVLKAAPAGLPERIHLHYVGIPLLTRLVSGPLNKGVFWLVYYYAWQVAQWREARRLHALIGFEACQHVTFVKYNVPSFLPLLRIPFIWGPVGGAEKAPAVFYREFGWKTRFAEAARVLLQDLALLDPWLRWCHHRSTQALAVTEQTAEAMRRLGAREVSVLPAVALSAEEIHELAADRSAPTGALTLIYVGRLIAWKGVHLGLRALASSANKQLRYRIIGDGPLRSFLVTEAHRLGIAERVEFTGNLPREAVLQAYAKADAFLYPSVHDSGGNAVLEAMGARLPVICLKYGGPDLLVTEACGWKVAARDPEEAVKGLATALDAFAADNGERLARGEAAREHCLTHHSWAARGGALREVYREMGRGSHLPFSAEIAAEN